MEVGLLDWCGAQRMTYVQMFMGCVSGMESSVLLAHDKGLMTCFAQEYAKHGGPYIDPDEMYRRFRLAYLGLMLLVPNFISYGEVYSHGLDHQQWRTVESRWDERVMGAFELRCSLTLVIQCLGYWAKRSIHADVMAWAREHRLDQGLYGWPPTAPPAPSPARLPSFIESEFTTKVEYERWVKEQQCDGAPSNPPPCEASTQQAVPPLNFAERPLEGQLSPMLANAVEHLKSAPPTPLEEYLYTEESIGSKRGQMNAANAAMALAFKPAIDAYEDKCDEETILVTAPVAHGGHTIKVIITRPQSLKDEPKTPAYVYAHGGGAVVFEAWQWQPAVHLLALGLKCVVFNVDYRNGPETKAPGGQQDMADVTRYLFEHGAKHGIDPNRMAMGGASGGAWVTLGAANLLAKADELSPIKALLLGCAQLSDEGSRVDESQLTDAEKCWDRQHLQTTSVFKLLASDYERQRADDDDQLYPGLMREEQLRKMPPIVCWTSEFDHLRKDTVYFAERARAAGRLGGLSVCPGVGHGQYAFPVGTPEQTIYHEECKHAFDTLVRNAA